MTPPTDTRRASGHTYGLRLAVVRFALVACGATFMARGAAAGAAGGDAGLDAALRAVLDRLDPLLQTPVALTGEEFRQLLSFVRDGLRDPRATPGKLRKLIPDSLPSGRPVQQFQ